MPASQAGRRGFESRLPLFLIKSFSQIINSSPLPIALFPELFSILCIRIQVIRVTVLLAYNAVIGCSNDFYC